MQLKLTFNQDLSEVTDQEWSISLNFAICFILNVSNRSIIAHSKPLREY